MNLTATSVRVIFAERSGAKKREWKTDKDALIKIITSKKK